MSFDALENWINSEYQEDAPFAPAAITQKAASDSTELLALFRDDGIFQADHDWSMDYRDLDECRVETAEILRAPPLERGEATGAEEVGVLPGAAFFVPPPAGYVHTDASGNVIPELDAIDRLILKMEGENDGSILPPPQEHHQETMFDPWLRRQGQRPSRNQRQRDHLGQLVA
uniref:Uncharacterized protein n=1 Tax=Timema bartmani TaxID=61472 RepID=A0A7R9FDK1_9NEOP|nr:unnamed protein product [Timema bartmani]